MTCPGRKHIFRHSATVHRTVTVKNHNRVNASYPWTRGGERLRLEAVWPVVEAWLEAEPERTARELLGRLQGAYPDRFPDEQLRTLQRRVKAWRSAKAQESVFGMSRPAAA